MKDKFTNEVYQAWCSGRCGGGLHLPYANILLASVLDKNLADGSQSQLRVDDDATRAVIQKEFDEFEALYQKETDSTQALIQKEFDETQVKLGAILKAITDNTAVLNQMVKLLNEPKTITKTLPASIFEGKEAQASAFVTLADGTQINSEDAPNDFHWYSSDESIISIDPDGTMNAHKVGMASISVDYKHLLESEGANVNVEAMKVTSVAILSTTGAAAPTTVEVGKNYQVRAQAIYNTGDKGNLLGSSAQWTSDNEAVATVEAGTIVGVTAGTANITASIDGVSSTPLQVTVTTPEGA